MPAPGGLTLSVISLCSMPAPPERKDFPWPRQILPAPGRNVTAGDKERNRCRTATKGGIRQNRQVLPERVPPIAAIRLGLCVKMSLSRPAGRDKLKNIKFIPLIMAERSGAIFQSSFRSASQNFQNMQFILAKVLFSPCEYCIMAISMQVLPVKKRLLAKAKLSNMTKKEVFYHE